jgi:ataxin-10
MYVASLSPRCQNCDLFLDLREHAIFTLHCLLKNNVENQALVDEVKAPATWDENGVLKDLPRVNLG